MENLIINCFVGIDIMLALNNKVCGSTAHAHLLKSWLPKGSWRLHSKEQLSCAQQRVANTPDLQQKTSKVAKREVCVCALAHTKGILSLWLRGETQRYTKNVGQLAAGKATDRLQKVTEGLRKNRSGGREPRREETRGAKEKRGWRLCCACTATNAREVKEEGLLLCRFQLISITKAS